MRMDMKPVQLADVVRNVVLIVAPAFSAKGQPLRVDLPPDLPLVQGDAGRLEQVVANLLTNANKYTLAGGEVRVYAEATAEAVSLVVADSGVGLTVHEQSRLFGKFFRARNAATRDVDGTGLVAGHHPLPGAPARRRHHRQVRPAAGQHLHAEAPGASARPGPDELTVRG